MPLRTAVFALCSLLLLACDPDKKPSPTEGAAAPSHDRPLAPSRDKAPAENPVVPAGGDAPATKFVSDAADYARRNLQIAQPRLSYLLLGCADMTGHLDPQSSSCPGSVVATFEDEPRQDDVAMIVVGKTGLVGGRRARASALSLAPAGCTIERFLEAARGAGAQWSAASDVFIGYGPSASGPAWTVKRGHDVVFSVTDASCSGLPVAPSPGASAPGPKH